MEVIKRILVEILLTAVLVVLPIVSVVLIINEVIKQ